MYYRHIHLEIMEQWEKAFWLSKFRSKPGHERRRVFLSGHLMETLSIGCKKHQYLNPIPHILSRIVFFLIEHIWISNIFVLDAIPYDNCILLTLSQFALVIKSIYQKPYTNYKKNIIVNRDQKCFNEMVQNLFMWVPTASVLHKQQQEYLKQKRKWLCRLRRGKFLKPKCFILHASHHKSNLVNET